jgi:hypothetical protein
MNGKIRFFGEYFVEKIKTGGMTKWRLALPCNVVADGWVEPPQETNLDKTG